jgi:hypothetical protein
VMADTVPRDSELVTNIMTTTALPCNDATIEPTQHNDLPATLGSIHKSIPNATQPMLKMYSHSVNSDTGLLPWYIDFLQLPSDGTFVLVVY